MDDKILVDNIMNGDRTALGVLMERYYGPLFVFSSRLLGDDFAAEDVVQDTFVHIWTARDKLRKVASVRNYLYGIVRNRCLVLMRAGRRTGAHSDGGLPEVRDIMSVYIETETMRLLSEAISMLPPRCAEVINLSLEGMKQEHIADRMGITVATVKALKADGIRKLRGLLMPAAYAVLAMLLM